MIDTTLAQYIKENIVVKYKARFDLSNGEGVISVELKDLVNLIRGLRDDTNTLFVMLISICGVDFPEREERFEVIYNLLSLKLNARLRVKVVVSEKQDVPSLKEVYHASGWYEREVYDMFGIKFDGNDDLRRILTDYGFSHYPLRKDFPVTGYEEVRYDIESKKIVYEPVKLDQEYREFDFLSPWEGACKQISSGEKKEANSDK